MPPLLYNSPAIACAEHASQRAAALLHAQFKRGLVSLALISSIAPLLGFLAALFGVMNSFPSFGASKSSIIAATAGLLSYALAPIVVGLFVAIPAYWFYQHLSAQLEIFCVEMDQATTQLVNQLIRYLQKTPPLNPRPLPLFIDQAVEAPAPELNVLLPRIWPDGLAELIWPDINSPLDATLVLHRTSTIIFLYAALTTVAYLLSDSPWTALVALVFFIAVGIGLRLGSYLAAASLLAYSAVTCFAPCVTDMWSFRTVTLAALPLFLIPWWKARRTQNLPSSLWSTFAIALALAPGFFSGAFAFQYVYFDSSREPALHSGEALISIATPFLGPLHRGDLVYMKSNEAEGTLRIVGLPGDRIQVTTAISQSPTINCPYNSSGAQTCSEAKP